MLTNPWWVELIIVRIELDNLITLLSHFCGVYVVLVNIICTLPQSKHPCTFRAVSVIGSSLISSVSSSLSDASLPWLNASFLWLLTQDFILTEIRFFVWTWNRSTAQCVVHFLKSNEKCNIPWCCENIRISYLVAIKRPYSTSKYNGKNATI